MNLFITMKNKLDIIFVAILFSIVSINAGEKVKKSADETDENKDDIAEVNDEAEDEDLDMQIKDVDKNSVKNTSVECNRMKNGELNEIRAATYRQFPFMAVVMSNLNEYMCSGVVVSNGLILTTARCAASHTGYVLLNATRDKFDDTTTMLHINKTVIFPRFVGFRTQLDIGLIYTEHHNNITCSKIRISNTTVKTVPNINGLEAIGYGLNTDTGTPRVMQYIGLELEQPIEDLESLTAYLDCVHTNSSVPACFKDTGSAVLFDNELIGIVYNGQKECIKEMFSKKTINIKMADIVPSYTFKAWLGEIIKNNEETWTKNPLTTYPDKRDAMNE